MQNIYIDFCYSRNTREAPLNEIPKYAIQNIIDIGKQYGYEVHKVSRDTLNERRPDANISEIYPIHGVYLEMQVEWFFKKLTKK